MTFQQLRNGRFSPDLATTRESWVKRRLWTEIYEKFPFMGHLPPKPQTWSGSNRHFTQSRLQVKGCTVERYCLLHVVVQGLGSFRGGNFFVVRHTVAELRGVIIAQFSDFGLFSPYKKPKKYLPVTSLQPRGYIAEWFRFFHVIAEGLKGCLPAAEFSSQCDVRPNSCFATFSKTGFLDIVPLCRQPSL